MIASILASLISISVPSAATPPVGDCGFRHPDYDNYVIYPIFPPECPGTTHMVMSCWDIEVEAYEDNLFQVEITHEVTTCACVAQWAKDHNDEAFLQCVYDAINTTHDSFESIRINYVFATQSQCCAYPD